MLTWTQIIILVLAVFTCVITVAICDITIINEIKKLRATILELASKL